MPLDTEPGDAGSSVQPAGLDLDPDRALLTGRGGLSFTDGQTEAAYRAWRTGGRWLSPTVLAIVGAVVATGLQAWLVGQHSDDALSDDALVVVSVAVWSAFAVGVLAALLAARRSRRVYAQERTIDHQRELVAAEGERSARLLRSIVPDAVAERIERGSGTVADFHPDVTVVIADLVGFGALVPALRPVELVDALNAVFTRFDALADLYEVERLKTVGDAYVAVGGLPDTRADHAVAAAQMALAMRAAVQQFNEARSIGLSVRIGMASGPVVAGVVGSRRFAYDVWGATVRLAAGLERNCESGRILISGPTSLKLSSAFDLNRRDPLRVRGMGEVEAWYLDGP